MDSSHVIDPAFAGMSPTRTSRTCCSAYPRSRRRRWPNCCCIAGSRRLELHVVRRQDDLAGRILWTYVDNRDVAQAIAKAIAYDVRGKDEFFITNDETVMKTPTEDLLAAYYPNAERRSAFQGNQVVLSNAKAKRVLGFAPVHLELTRLRGRLLV